MLLENGHCLLDEVDPDELHLLGLSVSLVCGDGGNPLPCPSHLVCKLLVLLRCFEQPLLLLRPLLFPAGCNGRCSLHFMNLAKHGYLCGVCVRVVPFLHQTPFELESLLELLLVLPC